ncbi:hypothetical protein JKG47_19290 [Acidithiobacillus sp. MC6.1]|nr:hypothetical protein [Acidithiobacillus sp. MC6.1]
MAEDNPVLEQLRKIRAELDAARERDHEIMARLGGIETGLTRITRDEAGNYAEIIQDRHAASGNAWTGLSGAWNSRNEKR